MKILVVHPGSLGDVILSAPALSALRTAFPEAHLSILGRPSVLELLMGCLRVDQIISIDRADVSHLFSGGVSSHHPLVHALKSFDLVINWLGGEEGELTQTLRKIAPRRVIASRPISQDAYSMHRAKVFLQSLSPLGIALPSCRPRFFPSGKEREQSRKYLIRQGIQFTDRPDLADRPILAVHPGSGGPYKCWKFPRFLEVARKAREDLGYQTVFIFGPAEQALASELKERRDPKIPVLDCLPLPILAGALTQCSAYLGNDSGMTHLAASVGVLTLAIFGPTDPELWGPIGDNVRILSKRDQCRACASSPGPETQGSGVHGTCRGSCCLDLISVRDVMKVLTRFADKTEYGCQFNGVSLTSALPDMDLPLVQTEYLGSDLNELSRTRGSLEHCEP